MPPLPRTCTYSFIPALRHSLAEKKGALRVEGYDFFMHAFRIPAQNNVLPFTIVFVGRNIFFTLHVVVGVSLHKVVKGFAIFLGI